MTELDVHNKAEAQLNSLIERRAREREQANWEAAAWAESVRKYNLARVREKWAAWAEHHRRVIGVHEALAARHRIALGKLIDGKA